MDIHSKGNKTYNTRKSSGIAIAGQRFHNTSAATNRGTIEDGVHYSVGREVIKGEQQTVQVQFSSRQGVQTLEDRSEDSSARNGSTEYRNQKIKSLVYVF
jgi:hypothetical protein